MTNTYSEYRPIYTFIILSLKNEGLSRDEVMKMLNESLGRVSSEYISDLMDQETYFSEMQKLHIEILNEVYDDNIS